MGPQHPTKDALELEAGLPIAHQEKARLITSTPTTAQSERQHPPPQRMSSPRRILLGLALCTLLWLGLTTAAPARQNTCSHAGQAQAGGDAQSRLAADDSPPASSQADSPFACLMNAVSSEALHDVLHRYFPNRFKDGVYESDHSAMEAVYREDPPFAASLIQIAKRQTGGSNGTTTTTSSSSAPPPPPTTSTSNTLTTSVPPPDTSTSTTPSTPTTPPPVSTTTTRPPTSTPEPDPTSPTTTKPGTTSSSRSQRPLTTTYTSTASNGDVVVVTATSFVPAEPVESTSTRPDGSLQTNAAVPRARNLGVEAFAGVVLGGLLLV